MKHPVSVLTGYLGAGKTTLLNALIRSRQSTRFAVVVNEFGALGIDGALVERSDESVIELSNGCLCCTVRGDLIEALTGLAERRDSFDHVVIETSGLADPAPVAQSFLLSDGPSDHFRLDGLVTMVDAVNLDRQLGRDEIAARQIALADRVILTKTDLVAPAMASRVETLIRRYNPGADIRRSNPAAPAFADLVGLNAYELGSIPADLQFAQGVSHDTSIGSESFLLDQPLDFTAFSRFVQQFIALRGEDILRIKGIIDFAGEDRRFAFHGVQALIDGDVVGDWGDAPRQSSIVIIGRNIDRNWVSDRLSACLA